MANPLDVQASTKRLHCEETCGGEDGLNLTPTLIAEILTTSSGEAILPTLHDVQIHGMATNALVITGIEFVGGVTYSQS